MVTAVSGDSFGDNNDDDRALTPTESEYVSIFNNSFIYQQQ